MQVRHVEAGNREEQDRGAEEQQQDRTRRRRERLTQGHDRGVEHPRAVAVTLLQRPREGADLALGRADVDAARHARDDGEVVGGPGGLRRAELASRPEVAAAGVVEARRHDADDLMHGRADAQRQRVERPAPEARAPQTIAHDRRRRAADALFLGPEAPSDERPHAHDVEELARHAGALRHRGLAADGHGALAGRHLRHRAEAARAGLPVLEVRFRHRVGSSSVAVRPGGAGRSRSGSG